MTLRTAAVAAFAVVASACGGDDAPTTTDTTTRADSPPPAPAAPSAEAADDPDAGVAASPKDDDTSDKPGAGTVATPAASSGKPGAPSAAPAPVSADGTQRYSGTLEAGDETLDSGEFADGYTVEVRAGQTITVDMAASDFDGYLILRSPSGDQEDNDDAEDSEGTDPRIVEQADETGTWRVVATSYEPGTTGAYRLTVRTSDR